MAWADSAKQFQQRVKESAKRLDCMIREMEKIEFLEAALKREECPDECFTMRATAEKQPNDVVFGTFHIWAQDDVN
jgi:hypothetical protein